MSGKGFAIGLRSLTAVRVEPGASSNWVVAPHHTQVRNAHDFWSGGRGNGGGGASLPPPLHCCMYPQRLPPPPSPDTGCSAARLVDSVRIMQLCALISLLAKERSPHRRTRSRVHVGPGLAGFVRLPRRQDSAKHAVLVVCCLQNRPLSRCQCRAGWPLLPSAPLRA